MRDRRRANAVTASQLQAGRRERLNTRPYIRTPIENATPPLVARRAPPPPTSATLPARHLARRT